MPPISSSAPCSACTWTPERQNGCRYQSHINLFYSCSDRGAWSIGSRLILKERGPASYRGHEVPNLQFVRADTSIPAPEVVEHWEKEDTGHGFILTRRLKGQTLHDAWSGLSQTERENIARETAGRIRGSASGPNV